MVLNRITQSSVVQADQCAADRRLALVTWLMPLLLVLAMTQVASGVVQLRRATNPVMVDVRLGSVEKLMNASPEVQAELVENLASRVKLAAADRQAIVALRPVDFALSYGQLSDRERST